MDSSQRKVVPYNSENLKEINLMLRKKIKDYGDTKALHGKLDDSIKAGITYEAMKKQLKTFNLRTTKNSKEGEKNLKIRISPHQFLLNNLLVLLGITFEDLFDASHFTGSRESENVEDDVETRDHEDTQKFLQTLDRKLDKIIQLNTDSKAKSFTERFFEVSAFLLMVQQYLLPIYNTPEEAGFSQLADPAVTDKNTNAAVYASELLFLDCFITWVHKNSKIHPLFEGMKDHRSKDILFGRLLSPFFILAIFFVLLENFIDQGLNRKKLIFWHYDSSNKSINAIPGKITYKDDDGFEISGIHDEEPLLDKAIRKYCRDSSKRLSYIIERILSTDIRLEENLCIEHEKLLCGFFLKMVSLFEKQVPMEKSFGLKFRSIMTRKNLEEKIASLYVPGEEFSYYITKNQIDTFAQFSGKLEDAQLHLEDYYVDSKQKTEKPEKNIGEFTLIDGNTEELNRLCDQ